MYEEYYKLTSDPFRLTPTGKHSFEHPSYRKARSYLEYALHRREGIAMVSGPPGTGKTTLIKSVARNLTDSKVKMNVLSCDKLNAQDLLRLYASDLGVPFESKDVGTLLMNIGNELTRLHKSEVQAVLVLDEAQTLTFGALEQARLLTNYTYGDSPLLQVVLVGQPELQDKVLSPKLAQLHQRIVSSSSLTLLDEAETREFFLHQMKSAGWDNNPTFQEGIYQLLFTASEGVPRWINQIGSRILLNGFVEQKQEIGVADARQVVTDLFREKLLPCSVDMTLVSNDPPGDDTFAGK